MDFLNIKIKDKTYLYKKGTTIEEISKQFNINYKYPILISYVDNRLVELNKTLEKDCVLSFVDCTSRIGSRIYLKGLIFLLMCAIKELYGYNYSFKVCHSIDKGTRIRCLFDLTEEKLEEIKSKMRELVNSNLPIEKCIVKRKEAINYFKQTTNTSVAANYYYTTSNYVTLYKLSKMYGYFYSQMPVNTSVFTSFDLKYLGNNEFVLQYPTSDGEIPSYVEHKKITEAFNKNYKSAKKLNIFTSSDINKIIAEGKINDIITLNEVIANNELLDLASQIAEKKDKVKVVLIAGPSSSGKTTTSRKLSMFLNTFGLNPKPLSLDDYFLPREKTPKLPNGDYDFESLRAIDIDLFNNQLRKLLNNDEVTIPTFNFKTGIPEFNKSLKLNENDIIIIEGLHCLNEELTKSIPRENKYKVYVSPLTDLNIDDYNMVSTSDNRLLRRIVRDNRTRGYTACHTIKTWDRVRDGEEKYIFPYQEEADFVFNSALIYEIGALRQYAEPLLYNIDINSPYYEEARRLLRFLNMFLVVPTENIPKESILREFIGGSYFE